MNTPDIAPGIKIGTHVSADASDDELLFLRQIGIEHVRIHVTEEIDSFEALRRVRDRFLKAGLEIFSVVHLAYQAREIAFGLSGRDTHIETLRTFIQWMGRLNLHTLEYDFFLYAPLPATGSSTTRGANTREFDLEEAQRMPPVTDRNLTPSQMQENHRYLVRTLLPAAETAGVRLALHQDDPPVPELLGVPRIFGRFQALEAALEEFDSPNWGILFCVGSWAEGGDAMGADLLEAIRFLAERKRLFTVHFRNVSTPLPVFHETFLDNGCVDMSAVMATLRDVGFNGLIIPDHMPSLAGDESGRASLAYAIGYMRALAQ